VKINGSNAEELNLREPKKKADAGAVSGALASKKRWRSIKEEISRLRGLWRTFKLGLQGKRENHANAGEKRK